MHLLLRDEKSFQHAAFCAALEWQHGVVSMSFWAITSYFNPCGYPGKLERFRQFADGVRAQGCKLMVVECDMPVDTSRSFAKWANSWVVKDEHADTVIRTQSGSVLWQKERLLTTGLGCLPKDCESFAWLDADITFENDHWVKETQDALKRYRIVQPFKTVFARGEYQDGMAFSQTGTRNDPHIISGHSGFAWAARRENFPGFYDRAIVGGGDTILGWAIYGHAGLWPGYGRARAYYSDAQMLDLVEWSANFHTGIQGQASFVDGAITHMEHGSREDRQYLERLMIPKQHNFSPCDLRLEGGVWEWNSPKHKMHEQVREYFYNRREEAA